MIRIAPGIEIPDHEIAVSFIRSSGPGGQNVNKVATAVQLRPDLRVPVLTVITETDLVGGGVLSGFNAARQPDTDKLRVWEIAGTAHADNYTFSVAGIDSGALPVEKLAAAYAPTTNVFGGKLDKPLAGNHGSARDARWHGVTADT